MVPEAKRLPSGCCLGSRFQSAMMMSRRPLHHRTAQVLIQQFIVGREVGVDDQQGALSRPVSLDGHDAVGEGLRQRKGHELRRPVRHKSHATSRLALSVLPKAAWHKAPALGPESLAECVDALGPELGLLEAKDVQMGVRRHVHDCPHTSRHSTNVASAHPQQGVRHDAQGPAPTPSSRRAARRPSRASSRGRW